MFWPNMDAELPREAGRPGRCEQADAKQTSGERRKPLQSELQMRPKKTKENKTPGNEVGPRAPPSPRRGKLQRHRCPGKAENKTPWQK